MSINSLKNSQDNPDINREDVEIASEVSIEDRVPVPRIKTSAGWAYSAASKRCRILVMNFVDILVEETSIEKNATSHQGQLRRCSQGSTYPSSEKSSKEKNNKF